MSEWYGARLGGSLRGEMKKFKKCQECCWMKSERPPLLLLGSQMLNAPSDGPLPLSHLAVPTLWSEKWNYVI